MTDPQNAPVGALASTVSRSRLEAISDGIMAVAITLLVLRIDPPTPAPGESLSDALLQTTLGELGIFALSFFLIARFWLLHHNVFTHLPDRVSSKLVALNFVFLALICLVPFTSELYTQYGGDPMAFAVYAITIALAGTIISIIAVLGGLPLTLRSVAVPVIFCASIPLAFVVPGWAWVLWLLILIVPSRRLESGGH